jgi:hypothetical protein
MIFAGPWLARRLETAEALNDAACVAAQPGAAVQQFAGGWAIFAGADSPLTRATAVGLNGRVSEREIDALESFFRSRGAPVSVDLCPLADAGLLESLQARGYRPVEFNNAVARPLAGLAPYPDERHVTRAGPPEAGLWARAVGCGFFEQTALSTEEMEIGLGIFRMGSAECYLAATAEGVPGAAGAALSVFDGMAVLFADATVPSCRRLGLQASLIRRRVNAALAHGCDLAAASVAPGGGSQRNYERLGFQVAYTKVLLVDSAAPHNS